MAKAPTPNIELLSLVLFGLIIWWSIFVRNKTVVVTFFTYEVFPYLDFLSRCFITLLNYFVNKDKVLARFSSIFSPLVREESSLETIFQCNSIFLLICLLSHQMSFQTCKETKQLVNFPGKKFLCFFDNSDFHFKLFR